MGWEFRLAARRVEKPTREARRERGSVARESVRPSPSLSPRSRGSSSPNLCSHFWSATRVSTQGPCFSAAGSGRIASPAQRRGRRPKVGGVRASGPSSSGSLLEALSPLTRRATRAGLSPLRGRAIWPPGRPESYPRCGLGVHFLQSYGCSRCGVGGLSRNWVTMRLARARNRSANWARPR